MSLLIKNPLRIKPYNSLFLLTKTLTSTPQHTHTPKKSLTDLFKEAVGLSETKESNSFETETSDFKNNLLTLERQIRRLKSESSNNQVNVKKNKPKKAESLYSVFVKNKEIKSVTRDDEDIRVFKELSPEMEAFVSFLYKEGYFNKANFTAGDGKLDFSCFDNGYGRDFIKFSTEMFAKDHQEIAKWLSGSDLKKVALFGCPSLTRKNVFSAKRLRAFFEINENTVCSKCALKDSCKLENKSVWNGDTKNLNLAIVLRIITLYAMEEVPAQLAVPDEIKACVHRLLKTIMNLSQTTA
ncbi:hypothetical protein CFOL_v3_04224 [Cephalotus follicularis]|uniref:Uncharacterized protein n=1 Tax=Cephalotus follicularis TaxID=3775 RepID=A0A1Q3AYH3_CEPFO|nr:hypothetical protein CFOL_v3_04224 [Cephalotus follicularis]